MGSVNFWDDPELQTKLDEAGAGEYVSKDEKDLMVEHQTPFLVTNVNFETGGGFQGADRYLVYAKVQNGDRAEDRKISFGTGVASRDVILEGMLRYFADDPKAEPLTVYMEMGGRAYLIRNYAGSEAEKNKAPFS